MLESLFGLEVVALFPCGVRLVGHSFGRWLADSEIMSVVSTGIVKSAIAVHLGPLDTGFRVSSSMCTCCMVASQHSRHGNATRRSRRSRTALPGES